LCAEFRPGEVDVASEGTVLYAVESEVDDVLTPLWPVVMADEADVDSEVGELFVVRGALESEATLLLVVDRPVESEPMPVDVEVDNEAIELFAELRPVEVEVDSEATVLSVVGRPVESEPIPVDVEVDSEANELFAELRAVEVEG
ncbi:hypothetical protein, partial [Burkholderia pseudomallei]|uniref:hypothetical protein n=1 Tax=Burkholderia pseudomallei TaxID=28450 RepID=UPI003CE6FC51